MLFFLPIGSNVPYSKRPYVCYAILICNLLVFLLSLSFPPEELSFFIFNPLNQAFHTTITCSFMHGGFLHLFFNMLLFYIVGFNVESKMGSARFAVFYLIAASFSSLTHGIFDPIRPLIGASGAVFAVMGAYLVLYTHAALRINFLPITFCFLVYYFIAPPLDGYPSLLPYIILFDYVFFGLIFRIAMTPKSWVLFLIFFAFNLRMGLATQDNMSNSISFWAHCGGFAFGAGFAMLFYGLEGLFHEMDGSVVSHAPRFLTRGQTRKRRRPSGALGSEGGVAFQDDLDPTRLSIVAQLQSAVYSRRPQTVTDLYDAINAEYPDVMLSPGPQLDLGKLLQEGMRDDLAIAAWENLVGAFPDSSEAKAANFKLARTFSQYPEHFPNAASIIATLRKLPLLKMEEVELDQLEEDLRRRDENRRKGLHRTDPEPGAAEDLGQSLGVGIQEVHQLYEAVDESWSEPCAVEAGANSAITQPGALPSMAPAEEAPLNLDLPETPPLPPLPPPPLPIDVSTPEPPPAAEAPPAPRREPPGVTGASMVLIRPDRPVDFPQMVQIVSEFFGIDAAEAERRLRHGKGILLKQAPAARTQEFVELLRAKGQDALHVPLQRELNYEEAVNVTGIQWSRKICLCETYSGEFQCDWAGLRMLSAARVKKPDMTGQDEKRVLDLFLRHPRKHLRIWENMFNHRRSAVDEEPLIDATFGLPLTVLSERAVGAVKTKSLIKATESEDQLPHRFDTLAEYENYNTWFLYTHCQS